MNIEEIQNRLREFARERDWEQFHSPKNLAAALSVEAAEILEHFQWLDSEASMSLSEEKKSEVAEEIADVLNYLLRLSDVLQIDLETAVNNKMKINAEKYPADKVRGSSKKYNEYQTKE
ncbi:MAG: nucleotide pyrophosphohydrolase [Pseudomonadales bacterium]|nr:nucleotide pyrophosphohydrolase [Pseudomonadales bacterium]MBO7005049.1 nucleotide pyrophosphohydrolase [Pseudomonadales bacterium]